MAELNFWGIPCPSRGTALSHAHSAECRTDHGGAHQVGQCCHCGHTPTSWAQSQFLTQVSEGSLLKSPSVPAPLSGHRFVFTISGRCAICAKPQDDHPLLLTGAPDVEGGCIVDHRSLKHTAFPSKEPGAEGLLERSRCPHCEVMVEPKELEGHGPQGPLWGPGRGDITARLYKKLGFLQYLYENPEPDREI